MSGNREVSMVLLIMLWSVSIWLLFKRLKKEYEAEAEDGVLGIKKAALRSIWEMYANGDYMTFTIFKRFIREFIQDMEIKDHTLLTLWNALGFTSEQAMSYKRFQKLFETAMKIEHDSPQSIRQIIKDRLKQLLAITLKAEHLLKPEGASNENVVRVEDEFLDILKQETKNAVEDTSMNVNINPEELQQKPELAHVCIDVESFVSTMKYTRRNSTQKEIWEQV